MTAAEMRAAREFRDYQRAALEAKGKPDIIVSALIRHYRHDCSRHGGRSVGLEMREHYTFSPDSRFGFIFTEGRCPACGVTARSGDSRLVDSSIRPPGPRAVITGR